jgi:hypothetical protein
MEIEPMLMTTNDFDAFVKSMKPELKQKATQLVDLGFDNELDSK